MSGFEFMQLATRTRLSGYIPDEGGLLGGLLTEM